MKCIMHNNTLEVKRVSNERAEQLVAKSDWKFVPKDEWKKLANTSWVKSSTPPNPMSQAKVNRKELRERAFKNRSK